MKETHVRIFGFMLRYTDSAAEQALRSDKKYQKISLARNPLKYWKLVERVLGVRATNIESDFASNALELTRKYIRVAIV